MITLQANGEEPLFVAWVGGEFDGLGVKRLYLATVWLLRACGLPGTVHRGI